MAKAQAATQSKKTAAPAVDAGTQEITKAIAEARPPIAALLASEIWAREAGIKFNSWEVVPPKGTPFENLLRPDFWANVSQRMRPGDTIIAFPRDGAWYGQLIVWDAGQNWANVTGACQERPDFAAAAGVDSEFEITRDPIDGVCVFSKKTGAKVKGNFPNPEDARQWILGHQRALRT